MGQDTECSHRLSSGNELPSGHCGCLAENKRAFKNAGLLKNQDLALMDTVGNLAIVFKISLILIRNASVKYKTARCFYQ